MTLVRILVPATTLEIRLAQKPHSTQPPKGSLFEADTAVLDRTNVDFIIRPDSF
jgi:hypothetical protein